MQIGWMWGLKLRGLSSSSTDTSLLEVSGSYAGSTTIDLMFTILDPTSSPFLWLAPTRAVQSLGSFSLEQEKQNPPELYSQKNPYSSTLHFFWFSSGQIHAYLSKQCAALTSQRSLRMEAPQVWRPWNLRLTCQGISPRWASTPPTIRLSTAGREPHADGNHEHFMQTEGFLQRKK